MSVEATWDIQTKASPRSLVVYPVVVASSTLTQQQQSNLRVGSSTNPFDPQTTAFFPPQQQQKSTTTTQNNNNNVVAMVYGTDRGSIHYRTFATQVITATSSTSTAYTSSTSRLSSSQQRDTTAASSSSLTAQQPHATTPIQSPLGSSSTSSGGRMGQQQQQQLPRHYYPMDLPSLLPGPVVACIACMPSSKLVSTQPRGKLSSSQQQQTFLLLVDDTRSNNSNKNSSGGGGVTENDAQQQQQVGSYASVLVSSSLSTPGLQIVASPWSSSHNKLSSSNVTMPRMSCAYFSDAYGGMVVYGSGRFIYTVSPELLWEPNSNNNNKNTRASSGNNLMKQRSTTISFSHVQLPAPGIRSGADAVTVIAGGTVAVVAVGNAFYAVAGYESSSSTADSTTTNTIEAASTMKASVNNSALLKIVSFQQFYQVYPVIAIHMHDRSMDPDWYSLFLASGRECAVVDVYAPHNNDGMSSYGGGGGGELQLSCSKPRNGTVTVASPILAAASSWPWIAFLQSDGLISIRSPSCLAVPLRTVEVGQRPNDYFTLRTAQCSSSTSSSTDSGGPSFVVVPWIVALAYSGECKVLQCKPDSSQDLADRLMRHAIDAFGTNGFPRSELAEAINASFTATSYIGPEASPTARALLKQYLEAVLGLSDFEGGGTSTWPTEFSEGDVHHGTFAAGAGDSGMTRGDRRTSFSGRGTAPTVVSSASPAALLTATALLCLVCIQLNPPNSTLANRAAKACAEKNGIVFEESGAISKATTQVCELVAEKLLREASSKFSLGTGSTPAPIARAQHRSSQSSTITDFVEAAAWLLRSCGKHERAIEVSYERLQQQGQQQQPPVDGGGENIVRGYWSQIKFDSYTATHLSEIWSAGNDVGCRLVLSSPGTIRLLENNPRLGLSVFTAMHPQNESQWRQMPARDDPLAHPDRVYGVLKLLKSIHPSIPLDNNERPSIHEDTLPLESGRAIAVAFLRSCIGIATGRPPDDDEFDALPVDADVEENIANFHDELSFLLLEGVIAECPPDNDEAAVVVSNSLGKVYQSMLRELLKWPQAKIRSEHLMESLPASFLQEKALLLGRLGRHDDALRILYGDLNSLDLALEYCDDRYNRQKSHHDRLRHTRQHHHPHQQQLFSVDASDDFEQLKDDEDNAYIPLVRVALESENAKEGTATAIKVLTLRRGAVDRSAALRLLPSDVPVSAVARPFLIPALVDGESQVRRMTVVAALLRARYLRLKEKLTAAQLKAQANIHVVPALRSLNLGDPLHSTKAFRARTTSATPGNTLPYIEIVKHFFPRHLVIQAKVTNAPYHSPGGSFPTSSGSGSGGIISAQQQPMMLSDVAFVVAESSEEEAIQPMLQVPIQVLPPRMTGSAWSVLSAAPNNMDGPTAQLTCELRYSVQWVDASSSSSSAMIVQNTSTSSSPIRTYVEELQDIEVHATHFSPKQY